MNRTAERLNAVSRTTLCSLALVVGYCVPICGLAQTVEYIHTDALGTPVAVTDAGRNVVERSEYEPYGALLNRPITDGPGYTGHVMDAQTGLAYMQQRYYDPSIGRFLSVDPVAADGNSGGNFNRYKYAANNPYRFTDPDGRLDRERIDQKQEIKSEARVANFSAAFRSDMRGVAQRTSDPQKIEKVASDRAGGLVSVDKVEGIVNNALQSTSTPYGAAEAVSNADRYVPTESGLVDLAHVAAAAQLPYIGPVLGDIREHTTSSYSSGMQEDFLAHDAARAANGASNPGAAAAGFIRSLGPLSEKEALKGMGK